MSETTTSTSDDRTIGDVGITEILETVGADPGAAQLVKQAELERGDKARSTLLAKLDKVIDGTAGPAAHLVADGGKETIPAPPGARSVAAVTDATSGRVLDPADYEVTSTGIRKTAEGSVWAAGASRWVVDFGD